ncbi:serine hydrolase [Bacillus sp. 31A1R]|uniref:Serine hydrolase n=1 Tax=Robertmurraya mangrovi TaxID=3098077 RepID=A0ABU5IWI7_9BACI|nr:serine hydrolase [Bacillus sp. 31A1R]MDZ5471507.1 serine hydrolase [Bacillus sp. 31A1R]
MSVVTFLDLEKKIKNIKIEGFIVNQGNKVIFEYLKNKKVKEKPTKVYSVTKSIVSLLIGILVDKGLIKNIHDPIFLYFPEILAMNEPLKKEISIFHLLTMTSGLKVCPFQGSKNWVKSIIEQPIIHNPGTTFQYNSGDSHLLSAIIKQVSGMPTAEFAEKYLFGPMGINKYTWVSDPQGIHGGGFSLSLNLVDMMKIGTLLLNEGIHKSKQLISSDWILQARYPHKQVEVLPEGTYGYGYQFWNFEGNNADNPINYYSANGLFGQYIFIVPELNIVAVIKSHLQDEEQNLPRVFFEELLLSLRN